MKLISSPIRLLGLASFMLSGALSALGTTDSDDEFRWRILPHLSNNPDSKVNLTLTRHAGFNTEVSTTSVPLSSLHGLEPGDFWGGPVSFHIRRDSGTLHCKGSFVMGIGSGSVRFEPDPFFISELKAMGISVKDDQLASLAFEDMRLSTVRDLREACPCVRSLDDVRDLSHHGVDGRYLRQVAQLSSGPLDIQDITSMKDHGVQTSLLEALKYGGYQLSAESVTELQDHGVDASFVRAMAPQFRSDRTAKNLVTLHDHGVSPEFVRNLRDAGVTLPADEIIQLHDHGVDAQMVRTAKDAGLDATPNSVIKLHDHGIEPQFVRNMEAAVHSKLTVDNLVELHDHGVSPEFAQQISASGFPVSDPHQIIQLHEHGVPADLAAEMARSHRSGSSANDLIRLHDHGVDAPFLRSFDAVGYSNASVDELIELHDHGVTADYAHHLQAEGFGVLPVAKLIQMKDHGV
jgi:hypothetical protein